MYVKEESSGKGILVQKQHTQRMDGEAFAQEDKNILIKKSKFYVLQPKHESLTRDQYNSQHQLMVYIDLCAAMLRARGV